LGKPPGFGIKSVFDIEGKRPNGEVLLLRSNFGLVAVLLKSWDKGLRPLYFSLINRSIEFLCFTKSRKSHTISSFQRGQEEVEVASSASYMTSLIQARTETRNSIPRYAGASNLASMVKSRLRGPEVS
jgi:hypothetical protein